ncbi:MAG: hypothetical protein HY741_28135 [Chloroflexi bacterium]|nr:hypothetical protein [Chloroflexota bacterium]
MASKKTSRIPKFKSLKEIADFWDTHSLADYDDETHIVEMTFAPTARRTYVGIESELLADLKRIARERRVSLQTLVNVWLQQRVDQLLTESPK